jgi:hypothetical protein
MEMGFKKIDPASYDWENAGWAQKTALVQAEVVPTGTQVTTRMKNGLVETHNVAKGDNTMLVTNPDGEQYLVGSEKFSKRYDARGDLYSPKSSPVKTIQVREDVSFTAPWGEEMKIARGGVLVNAGENDIYGIQREEFANTYTRLKTKPDQSIEQATKEADRLLAIKARAAATATPPTAGQSKKRANNGIEL